MSEFMLSEFSDWIKRRFRWLSDPQNVVVAEYMSTEMYYAFRMLAMSLCDERHRPRGDWKWHRWQYLERRLFDMVLKKMEQRLLMKMVAGTTGVVEVDEKSAIGELDEYQLQWLNEQGRWSSGSMYTIDVFAATELLGSMAHPESFRYVCAAGKLYLPECDKDGWVPVLMKKTFDKEFDANKLVSPFKFRGDMIGPVESYEKLTENPTCRDWITHSMESLLAASDPTKKESGEGDFLVKHVRYDNIRADYTMEQWLADYQPYYAPCQLMAFRRAGQQHLLFDERQFIGHAAKHGMNRGEGLFFLSALFNKTAPLDLVHFGPRYDKERRMAFNEYRTSFAKIDKVFGSGCKKAVDLGLCPFVNPLLKPEQMGNLFALYVPRDTPMFGYHLDKMKSLQKMTRNWTRDRHKEMCRQMALSVGSMVSGGQDATDKRIALTPNAWSDHVRECAKTKNKRLKVDEEKKSEDSDMIFIELFETPDEIMG